MARKAKLEKYKKQLVKAKHATRVKNRCPLCGRPRAYMREFNTCRICFRQLAREGAIPGLTKSSW